MDNKKIKRRAIPLIILLVVIILLIILKLFFIQILKKDFRGNKISSNNKYTTNIKAKRGSILTNDKLELAIDLEFQNFVIDPMMFNNLKEIEIFSEIISSEISEINKEDLISKILKKKESNSKYLPFDKILITSEQKDNILNKLVDNNISKGVIFFNKVYNRKYVDREIFETIVGYLNNENIGIYGLEHRYNEILKGEDGLARGTRPYSEALAEYTLPFLIDKEILKDQKNGNNLHLNINSIFQYALDDLLNKAFIEYDPISVMGIVIESDTGKILALDSYPKARNRAEIKNLNITNLFEPGSIFKPITVAAAINEKLINENTLISSDGFIKIKDRIIRDHDDTTKGIMPVSKIMAHSGNVGIVKISQMLEPKVFYNYLEKFGLGFKTNIDASYEMSNKLMSYKDFTEVRRSNVSFGQGINMTQIQMLMALNATINDGYLLEPKLVDMITDADGKVIEKFDKKIINRPIDERTSLKIRKMLEEVVSSGTGKGINIDGYRIGGKTGTAQKAGQKGYEKGKYFSSFFTFFPADKPKYSILITVDEPKGKYYGAAVALPIARELLDKIIKYKNIIPNNFVDNNNLKDEIIKKNINHDLSNINNDISNNLMPNLIGLSRKNLLNINLSKYKVIINGNGIITNQIPEAGTRIDGNTVINLNLK